MKVHDIASVVRAGEVGFHSENEFDRCYTQEHTIVKIGTGQQKLHRKVRKGIS